MSDSSNSKVKRAILIGVEYSDISGNLYLQGCGNDVFDMREYLVNKLDYKPENICILCDSVHNDASLINKQPTAQNIVEEMLKCIREGVNTEELWIHYSGHGSQKTDTNSDETDGKDEFIIPSDYKTAGVIHDDILRTLISMIKCRTILVFDCCHSGTICDLPYQYDLSNNVFIKTQEHQTEMVNREIFKISGSRDNQTSLAMYSLETSGYRGACTNALLDIFNYNPDLNITFETLIKEMHKWMKEKNSHQRPTLTCSYPEVLDINLRDLLLPYLSTSSPQISQQDHDTAVNSLNEEISNLNQLKELYIKRLKYLYMKIDQLKA